MTEFKTPKERIRGIQLAIYKHGRRFEVGKTENKSSKWPERDPTLGSLDCESNALITRPCCPAQLPSQGKLYLSSLLQKFGVTLTTLTSVDMHWQGSSTCMIWRRPQIEV